MNLRSVVRTSSGGSRRRRLTVSLGVGAILMVALVVSIVSLALATSPSFPDVPASHLYYAAITDLASRGIIGGYNNGNFGPGDPVTRQQFAKMIVKTAGYNVTGAETCPFTDVDAQTGTDPFYPSKYVAVCATHNITTGKTATTFDPSGKITRYQAISMAVRMADNLQPGLLATPPATWNGNVTWGADPTHGPNAARAEYNGLLAGIDLAALSPTGNMSRGEVAQVLHNLLGKLTPTTTTTQPSTTTTTVPSATLLFRDDFSSVASGWWNGGEWPSGLGSSGYESGAYYLYSVADHWMYDGGPLNSWNLHDGRIEADVTLVQGDVAHGSSCGLVFRAQNQQNLHAFEFSGGGYYSFWRREAGTWTHLVDWTYSSAIKHLGQTNHVEVVLSGNSFSVSMNGTLLFTKADAEIPSGTIGLYIDNYGVPGKATFDNLEIWSK